MTVCEISYKKSHSLQTEIPKKHTTIMNFTSGVRLTVVIIIKKNSTIIIFLKMNRSIWLTSGWRFNLIENNFQRDLKWHNVMHVINYKKTFIFFKIYKLMTRQLSTVGIRSKPRSKLVGCNDYILFKYKHTHNTT